MSDYHNSHWVEFFHKSRFSAPIFVEVNCITFDVLSRLNEHDADLFFAMSHCFICHHTLHRSEACSQCSYAFLFCKRLTDPHRELTSSLFVTSLSDVRVQSGMRSVLVLPPHYLERPSERPRNRVIINGG
jgi:hypothetical protein